MKPFEETIKLPVTSRRVGGSKSAPLTSPDDCAALLLDTAPRVLRAVRMAMAALEAPALTIPQFRTLHFVDLHAGGSLSQTAEFLGLTLPSTSKLVDQLVKRGMLARNDHAQDRRRMTLRITPKGDALLKSAQASVRKHLAGMLNRLDATQLAYLFDTLTMIQDHFPSHAGMSAEMHLGSAAKNGNGNLNPTHPKISAPAATSEAKSN